MKPETRMTALVFVIAAFTIAAVRISDHRSSERDKKAARAASAQVLRVQRDALKAVIKAKYQGDIDNWHRLRSGCNRSVQDRKGNRRLLLVMAKANRLVSRDAVNTGAVHRARAAEAALQQQFADQILTRIPPYFTCRDAFPKPRAPKGVTPLP